MTEKKNPDYSASAVNLTNSGEVVKRLHDLRDKQKELSNLQTEVDALIPTILKEKIASVSSMIDLENKLLRETIDTFGSYQNTELGDYALKQRKESINYKPELVRQYAPSKVASFVIIESVDSKALDALVKAGQLTPEVARQCGEVKESFAYIIK